MLLLLAAFAGLVRGYSGFGFAMIMALGMLGSRAPTDVIPTVLLLDLVGSASLWRRALRDSHRRLTLRLVGGLSLALPVGVLALAWVPAAWLAPCIALVCLAGGVMVLRQSPEPFEDACTPLRPAFWVGLGAGLATVLASAGGPPLMLYLLRCGLTPRALRATAIMFFAVSSALALVLMGLSGVMGREHLQLAASLLLPAMAGNLLGQWLQPRWQPVSLHRLVGLLLVVFSAVVLYRSLAG